MNEQFYLVLPSNCLLNIFQENKTSYKVQLPYPLELDITKLQNYKMRGCLIRNSVS